MFTPRNRVSPSVALLMLFKGADADAGDCATGQGYRWSTSFAGSVKLLSDQIGHRSHSVCTDPPTNLTKKHASVLGNPTRQQPLRIAHAPVGLPSSPPHIGSVPVRPSGPQLSPPHRGSVPVQPEVQGQ